MFNILITDYLEKKCKFGWQKRHFTLETKSTYLLDKKDNLRLVYDINPNKLKKMYPITKKVKHLVRDNSPNCQCKILQNKRKFTIIYSKNFVNMYNPNNKLVLRAKSVEDANLWVNIIKNNLNI